MLKIKFWIFCALVLIVMGANFIYTVKNVDADMASLADSRLTWAESQIRALESDKARLVMENAQSAARIDTVRLALVQAAESETSLEADAMQEVAKALGDAFPDGEDQALHELLVLATKHGAAIFSRGEDIEVEQPLAGFALAAQALEGSERSGVAAREGKPLRMAAVPVIHEDDEVKGSLLLGYSIDDGYIRALAEGVGLDVSLVVGGQAIASTLSLDFRNDLLSEARSSSPGRTFAFGDSSGGLASMTASITGADLARGYGRKILLGDLEGSELILSITRSGGVAWLDGYQTYQFSVMLLLLVVGLGWGFFMAFSANEPVRRMVEQLGRFAAGESKSKLEIAGFTGEARRLAEMINSLMDHTDKKTPIASSRPPDISSLLGHPGAESEEEDPESFDFGFGGTERRDEEKKEESESASDQTEELEEESADDTLEERLDDSSERSEVEQEADLFAVFGSGPKPAEDEDPFADFGESAEEAKSSEDAQEAEGERDQAQEEGEPEEEHRHESEEEAASESEPQDDEVDKSDSSHRQTTESVGVLGGEGGESEDGGDLESGTARHDDSAETGQAQMPPFGGAATSKSTDPFAEAMSGGEDEDEDEEESHDATIVAQVPQALLEVTKRGAELAKPAAPAADPDDEHFKEVFELFVKTRQDCGEQADGLNIDKFVDKLRKNRDSIKEKYGVRSVRFQVHVKDGKAALKATPIR